MKTTTSKVLLTGASLILIFFLASSFNRSGTGNKYLTVRTMESPGFGSKIFIVYENGNSETIDLDKTKANNIFANTIKISETINNIVNKGYELSSVTGGDYITNYLFVKK